MMDEILWKMERQTRQLQEWRAQIGGDWDDDAAVELNGRYLDPHAEDATRMERSLRKQEEKLAAANVQIVAAEVQALVAHECGHRVDEALHVVEQEMGAAYAAFEAFVEYHVAARQLLPVIEELIKQANQACSDSH